jgi:hypothetical protein
VKKTAEKKSELMIPNTTRTGSGDCKLDGSMATTAPDADHPNQADISGRPAPDDSEYQGNIEERHDNTAEHSNDLNYPHSFTDLSLV